jgi:predicted ATPase/DNA-binding winged helix-turn-helix (wHTH) protein
LTTTFSFGRFELRPESRELTVDGRPVALGARAFDVLHTLIQHRERIVTKEELLDLAWPGVVVEENNLQVQISTLRKQLGQLAIATIPGHGYRFTAALNDASGGSSNAGTHNSAIAHHSFATQREALFGRDDDIRLVGELLHDHAQVSIVGAGGMGKTRLALSVADAQRGNFADRVWWVELAALSEAELVVGAIAQALGVHASGEQPLIETVIALVRHQNGLLVLDNCEHLLDTVADCARTLTTRAPRLRILVTSQEALRTSDEHVYRVAGLPTESTSESPAAACALFIARAEAADPRLRLSGANLSTVAEICRRLDGMPLAIELAAARVRLLGIEGVRARLDERFHILTGGTRTVLRRHQRLYAALEWSHDLLSSGERVVFRRLGVFAGGFTLELAQHVAADDRIDRWAVLDMLGHLVDKSLVVVDGDEVPRYRLLETMRAFALEQLTAAAETPTMLRRHAEALFALLAPLARRRWTSTLADRVRDAAELDNLRAALTWADSRDGDRALACRLFGSSRGVWTAIGQLNEGIERACRLLPLPDGLTKEEEANFWLTLGVLGFTGARHECFVAAERAAELHRSLGDTSRLIEALIAVASIGARRGETHQAAAAIAEAESLLGPDAPARQAASLALAKTIHFGHLGLYEKARASAMCQAAIYGKEKGNEWGVQYGLENAAWCECALGRADAAIPKLMDVIATLRRLNATYGVGVALSHLACAHALRGDRDEALENGRAAVPELRRSGTEVGSMLPFIAMTHAQHGSSAKARALVGYFDNEMAKGRRFPPFFVEARDKALALAQAALGPDEACRQTGAGGVLTEEQILALAFDDA